MALETFSPPVGPSPGTSFNPEIQLNVAEFGDSYTQASPRGLNHIRENIALHWEALTDEQYREIRGFFETHGGYVPFLYTPRGRSTPMQFTCPEWSGSDAAPWTFSATLKQDFSAG